MNVQDDAGLADPTVTAVVPRVPAGTGGRAGAPGAPGGNPAGQGQLFADAYPTYADTDQLPAVSGRKRPPAPHRPSRWLRAAVIVVAIAVLGAAAALGLVKSGAFKHGSANSGPATTGQHTSTSNPSTPVATQTSTGSGTATYRVAYPIYAVTVSTTTTRSWVSIGATGQPPRFAGILEAGNTQKVTMLGPSTVEVGAGGTTIAVTVGKHTTTLTPPSAPFTYQFEAPKKS